MIFSKIFANTIEGFRPQFLTLNLLIAMITLSCSHNGFKDKSVKSENTTNVLFLHHSTGNRIFKGNNENNEPQVDAWFKTFNQDQKGNVNFVEQAFPLSKHYKVIPGYGWKNYPYDYYNIWVKNSEKSSYKFEPTLKTLTLYWDVIIFKHCFPVSLMVEDQEPNIDSQVKSMANYKLQYNALKKKLVEFPDTKFIVWTGAALAEKVTNEKQAQLARDFFSWVKNEWDKPDDNIYVWDFHEIETAGGLFLKPEYSSSETDSHPNAKLSTLAADLFCQRVVDVIYNNGEKTNLLGEELKSTIAIGKNELTENR